MTRTPDVGSNHSIPVLRSSCRKGCIGVLAILLSSSLFEGCSEDEKKIEGSGGRTTAT